MGYPIPPCIKKEKTFLVEFSSGALAELSVGRTSMLSVVFPNRTDIAHGQLKLIADAHLDNKFPNIIIAAVLV